MRIRLTRKRANNFLHSAGGQQRRQSSIAVTRIVVDDREIPCAVRNQRIDQLAWHTRIAEAADHDRCAIEDSRDGGIELRVNLVNQIIVLRAWWGFAADGDFSRVLACYGLDYRSLIVR